MLDVRKLLAQRPLLFDGGMGTYYKAKPGQECEQANLTDPEGILAVHRAYLAAGADAIKTNTFSLPRLAAAQQPGWEQLADAGWQLAAKAAGETGAAVFADLGPAPDTENLPAEQVYLAVAKRFALLGARNFLFETLSAEDGVLEEWVDYDAQFTYELRRGEDGIAEVNGALIDSIFERIDPDDPDSMRHFAKLLEDFGIIRALREFGVKDGQEVRLNGETFDFVD